MGLSLLARLWPYLAGATLVIGAGWYLHHSGVESGRALERADWQPRFEAAKEAADKANAAADAKEDLARKLAIESDTRYARTIMDLNSRAADTSRSITQLVRQLAARAGGGQVPEAGGPTAGTDAAPSGDPRIDGAAASIGDTGRRCEQDAAQLAELQRFVTEQNTIVGSASKK